MPLTSNNKIVIPEQVTDTLAVTLIVNPIFKVKEVSARAIIQLQPYRVAENGDTVKVGAVNSIVINDVFEEANSDPAIAKIVEIMFQAIQDFINLKNL